MLIRITLFHFEVLFKKDKIHLDSAYLYDGYFLFGILSLLEIHIQKWRFLPGKKRKRN